MFGGFIKRVKEKERVGGKFENVEKLKKKKIKRGKAISMRMKIIYRIKDGNRTIKKKKRF